MPLKVVWLKRQQIEKIKELKINFSKFVREKIDEYLREKGIEITENDPKLIIRIKCPSCGKEQNTTTVRTVRCFHCDKQYRVYRARGTSRIVSIIKGDKDLLFKRYYETKKGAL